MSFLDKLLDKITFQFLIIMTIFLGLSPFIPEPHLWQKLKMLLSGELSKPIDIFDMVFHGFPAILLALKFFRSSGKNDA